ncbi:Actin-depolymerizing factor 11 [Capsicum annuum]|nr:Actin-depolymerizing factor 11 [Capsicum annuum]
MNPIGLTPPLLLRDFDEKKFSGKLANAPSGMGVADQSKATYMELQRKKVHRYVIFKIDEKKNEVVVEKTGCPAESYDDFTAALPENDCRYAVYDYDFVTPDNCQKSKIFFFAWSPSVSRIRSKMLYATSKDRFRRELEGIHYEIQATDPTEVELEVLKERAY